MSAALEVTIGMADVDAYAFLYYANYIKYNERAACLAAGTPLVLTEVEDMTFPSPVHWGSEVTIHTFLCPDDTGSTSGCVRLLHAWTVAPSGFSGAAEALKPVVHNASVTTYTYAAPDGAASMLALRAPPADHPLYAPLMACVRENRTRAPAFPLKCARLAPARRATMLVSPDAVGFGGRLQPSVAMDLLERHRTAIIGGQPSLASLQEESVEVVVCRLRGLRLLAAPQLGSTLQCVSAEAVSCGGLIYDVLQRIVATDTGAGADAAETDTGADEAVDPAGEAGAAAQVLAECTVRSHSPSRNPYSYPYPPTHTTTPYRAAFP